MPDAGATPSPLRFVVLRHDGVPDPHFDLMFERQPGGALRTWRSPVWPLRGRVRLTPLDDHRRAFLDYEGPVSGGRGQVARVAAGTFLVQTPDTNTWEFTLDGAGDVEGILIRMWRDSRGRELCDAASM